MNRLGTAAWSKVDASSGDAVGGATFVITATDGPAADLFTTRTVVDGGIGDLDADAGEVAIAELPIGTYTVTETIPPAGYGLPEDAVRTFEVTQDSPDVAISDAFNDPRLTGDIDLIKTDASTHKPLDGATFQLWLDDGDATLEPAQDTRVGEVTTTTGGAARWAGLAWGTYFVEEVTPPTGYLVDPDSPLSVTIGATALSHDVAFADPRILSVLEVSKVDDATDAPLEGAQFTLWRDVTADGPSADDTAVVTVATGQKGTASATDLDWGTYYWEETTAPVGYLLPDDVHSATVTIDAANAGTAFPISAFRDERMAPALTIDKEGTLTSDADVDGLADVGDVISYAFTVTNTGNVALTDVAVNDDRVTVACPATELAAHADTVCTAEYTVVEADIAAGAVLNTATAAGDPPAGGGDRVTSAPDSDEVPVDDAGWISGLAWRDYDGDGVREAGDDPLAGITVTLRDAAGVEVATTATAADGSYLFDDVPLGDYTVAFTDVPADHHGVPQDVGGSTVESEPFDSDVDPDTAVTGTLSLTIENDEVPYVDAGFQPLGSISWTKIAAGSVTIIEVDGIPVGGSVWELVGPGHPADDPLIVADADADGEFLVEGLQVGEYTVTEVTPAPGYTLGSPPASLTVTIALERLHVSGGSIANQQRVITLPVAGSTGPAPYLAAGAALLALAGLGARHITRRNTTREDRS
ncbi:SpaA isopeptide-forming pilin-related protein [Microbacterium sediminis]|uniref:SpaA isopeptide-forming pilin-related protein n=1 Tax=Microbacterium sediminis TaxID=904291 RepID=UPI001072311A|nr:SpaA isopeptide-forming pilin-related protein [Microbacterium sediminis]QBR73267.1 hypothetical protein E3O41_01635 [Microbacterium sediminis]